MDWLSSIAASVAGALTFWALKDGVLPLARGKRFGTSKIEGCWELFEVKSSADSVEAGRDADVILDLKQRGDVINGSIELENPVRKYIYTGHIRADQVLLLFEQEGQPTVIGTLVLKLRPGGNRLVARNCFWHHDSADLVSRLYVGVQALGPRCNEGA